MHLDPWWNPAVEDQASDRAHPMGQLRPVTICRLVAEDTIEEKIVQLHAGKRDLADSLLDGTEVSGKLNAEELLALIKGWLMWVRVKTYCRSPLRQRKPWPPKWTSAIHSLKSHMSQRGKLGN